MATALFMFVFTLVFTWRRDRIVQRVLVALVLAIAVAVSVTLLFERVFLVRLP